MEPIQDLFEMYGILFELYYDSNLQHGGLDVI